jgi:D-alanine-D-alanine ligase
MPSKAKRPRRPSARSCLGPVADLEAHLPEEWWRKLFNALYVKTDGDVVENLENTRREVDFIVSAAAIQPYSQILDLCCGQGRHCLELARRGFKHVMGLDRSRYLVRLAKKRAQGEGLQVLFKEGDARNPRLPENSMDCVAIMGNSFGYFSNKQDDEKVLTAVGKILRPSGQIVLDITDGSHMHDNFERRSWEWIDEHHFVCRERSISQDGERLISREVIVHDEMGVIADQFYAERLYTRDSITKLLEKTGFRNVRHHGHAEALSDRDQDLGMMARRILLTADAPQLLRKHRGRLQALDVTVVMGDHRLPDQVKRGGTFNPEDLDTVRKLKDALSEVPGYKFRYLDNHGTLERDLSELRTDLVFNLCDEGCLLRQGVSARGSARAGRAGAAGIIRAPGRPGGDTAIRLSCHSKTQPGRQQSGHYQGIGRHQREGPARLPRPAARRVSQTRRAGAGVPHRGGILRWLGGQSGPGPQGFADPGGRLLQARR